MRRVFSDFDSLVRLPKNSTWNNDWIIWTCAASIFSILTSHGVGFGNAVGIQGLRHHVFDTCSRCETKRLGGCSAPRGRFISPPVTTTTWTTTAWEKAFSNGQFWSSETDIARWIRTLYDCTKVYISNIPSSIILIECNVQESGLQQNEAPRQSRFLLNPCILTVNESQCVVWTNL